MKIAGRFWGRVACTGLMLAATSLFADDAAPAAGPMPPADIGVAPPADAGQTLPPADLPMDASSGNAALKPVPEGTPAMNPGAMPSGTVDGVPIEPVPVYAGGCPGCGTGWGWGPYATPGYTYSSSYSGAYPGYGGWPTSWNGYWNYSTGYGAAGYTAYWHGWNAMPYNFDSYAGGYGNGGGYGYGGYGGGYGYGYSGGYGAGYGGCSTCGNNYAYGGCGNSYGYSSYGYGGGYGGYGQPAYSSCGFGFGIGWGRPSYRIAAYPLSGPCGLFHRW